ncbi:MAG: gliding motility-associated C-terminal domain-containing protein [Cytophagaceae bacterium]
MFIGRISLPFPQERQNGKFIVFSKEYAQHSFIKTISIQIFIYFLLAGLAEAAIYKNPINNPLECNINGSFSHSNVTCFTGADGTISFHGLTGGSGNFEYSINGGSTWQTTASYSNLSIGNYQLLIRDAEDHSCTKIIHSSLTITRPNQLSATISFSNINCHGAATGTINFTSPSGGSGDFEYSVDAGSNWQPSRNFTGLTAGTYQLRMRDANATGCIRSFSNVTLSQPGQLHASITSSDAKCFNTATGVITLNTPVGGGGTYQYSIDGGTSWQSSGNYNVPQGTYHVMIRDAATTTCNRTLNPSIVINQPGQLNADITSTNLTCYNTHEGIIELINITGGSGNYDYSIGGNVWTSSPLFPELAAGNYNVQIRDADFTSCTRVLNNQYEITQPTQLHAVISSNIIICHGESTGEIKFINPTGGSGSHRFTINGGTTWSSNTNYTSLPKGIYKVMIGDDIHQNCTRVLEENLEIIELENLNATVNSNNPTCYNVPSGSITISNPTGGGNIYQYSIDGGISWQMSGKYNNLPAGNYDIRIRDAITTSCFRVLENNRTLSQPAQINATVTATDANCFGTSTGSINISDAEGGSGNFQYSINGGNTWSNSGNFPNLATGFYDVRIRDANTTTCSRILNGSVFIDQPAKFNAVISSSYINCYGAATGTITFSSPSGGSGSYQYSVNGGQTWQVSGTFTGLSAGTYNVMMRDVFCAASVEEALIITQPDQLSATINSQNINCFGAGNGSISIVNPGGGGNTYQYSIDGGNSWQASGNYNNLLPGNYDVKIRDGATPSCVVTLNGAFPITQFAKLSADFNKSNISCNGLTDGSITFVNPAGGSGSYQFSINNGVTWQFENTFTGLGTGTYNLYVRDGNHNSCSEPVGSTVISQPSALNASISTSAVTCNGGNNGSITVTTPSGGSGNYEYSKDNGLNWQDAALFSGLTQGSYTILIRDKNATHCTKEVAIANITQPIALSASVSKGNVSCNGGTNGFINISNAAGGSGDYEYSIDNGNNWSNISNHVGLGIGNYQVLLRDKNHPACVFNAGLIQITQPAVLSATVSSSDVTCHGGSNGTIIVSSPAGGSETYQYSIDGTNWITGGSFTGLSEGSYNVQIRDAAFTSCVVSLGGILINQPDQLAANVTLQHVTCFGLNNGSIAVNTTGGSGNYQYSINNGTTWNSGSILSGLTAGNYVVMIRDVADNNCQLTLPSASINQPAAMTASIDLTQINCFSSNTGGISITNVAGGTGNYQYSINGGTSWSSNGNFSGLSAGNYTIVINDLGNSGCSRNFGVHTISQPDQIQASVIKTDITCNTSNDGSITVSSPTGGSGTYQYSINGGTSWGNTGSYTNLSNGTYNVVIRDLNHTNCQTTLQAVTINRPSLLNADVVKSNVSCNGGNNGIIDFNNAIGGSGSYQYSINGGNNWSNSDIFTGLSEGAYVVVIRDFNATTCARSLGTVTINQPSALSASTMKTDVNCYNGNDGSITVTPSGGSGTYQFSSDGGNTWVNNTSFTGLTANNYQIFIRDFVDNACQYNAGTLAISQPQILNALVSSLNVTCFSNNNGQITFSNPTGGKGNYLFSIDGAQWLSSNQFNNLSAGTYSVFIADADVTGCTRNLGSIIITQPVDLSAEFNVTHILCNSTLSGEIEFKNVAGGSGSFEYSINNGTNWNSNIQFSNLAAGNYQLLIRDAINTGCVKFIADTSIVQPQALSAQSSKVDVTCFGGSNGSITFINATGGSNQFEYSINGGSSWQTSNQFIGLAAGSYSLSIRDQLTTSCNLSLGSITINQPAALSASVQKTDISCAGGNTGEIQIINALGGSGSYLFSITNGSQWTSTNVFPGLASGVYPLVIKDAADNDCEHALGSFPIVSHELSLNITFQNVSCHGGANGQISLTPVSSNGPYEYNFNGSGWSSLLTYNNLTSGTYSIEMREVNNHGCNKMFSATLTAPAILQADVAYNNSSCHSVADGNIYINNATGGSGTYGYSINGGADWNGSSEFINLPVGTYNVQIRDNADQSCVIVLNNSITITQPTEMAASVESSNASGCIGNPNGEIRITGATGGSGAYQYSINGGTLWQSNSTFTNVSSGTYSIVIRDASAITCQKQINPAYIVQHQDPLFPPALTNHPEDARICEGGNVSFTATAEENSHPLTWQWMWGGIALTDNEVYSGTNTPILTISNASDTLNGKLYHVVVSGICQPDAISAKAELRVDKPEPATVTGSANYCFGLSPQKMEIAGVFTEVLHWEYSTNPLSGWSLIETTESNIFAESSPGDHFYKAYIKNGACTPMYTDSAKVTIYPTPIVSAGKDTSIIIGKSIQLQASGGVEYKWENEEGLNSTDVNNPVVNPKSTTVYSVVVTDENGCTASANITIEVKHLLIPNTFTPNSDGTNDVWRITNIHFYPDASVEIFNRWGVILFKEKGQLKGWDGKSNGAEMPAGTYYYTLKTSPDADPISGFITIVK